MGHKVVSGQVIDTPDTVTPSGHNDGAARDAHSHYDVEPNPMAAKVFVSAEEWAEFVHSHGGEVAYGRRLGNEADRLKREGKEVKTALVFMAARLISADPAAYRRGKGWNQTAIAEAVGIRTKTAEGKPTNRDLVGTIGKGAVALVESDSPLYGVPSPEVVALAMDYAEQVAERKKRGSTKGNGDGDDNGDGGNDTPDDTPEAEPLAVADLVAALEAAHKVLDQLDVDHDDEKWADVSALIDSLSDKFHAA